MPPSKVQAHYTTGSRFSNSYQRQAWKWLREQDPGWEILGHAKGAHMLFHHPKYGVIDFPSSPKNGSNALAAMKRNFYTTRARMNAEHGKVLEWLRNRYEVKDSSAVRITDKTIAESVREAVKALDLPAKLDKKAQELLINSLRREPAIQVLQAGRGSTAYGNAQPTVWLLKGSKYREDLEKPWVESDNGSEREPTEASKEPEEAEVVSAAVQTIEAEEAPEAPSQPQVEETPVPTPPVPTPTPGIPQTLIEEFRKYLLPEHEDRAHMLGLVDQELDKLEARISGGIAELKLAHQEIQALRAFIRP